MSKVMVTGALGNVGGYVAKYLIQNSQSVVAADINLEALKEKYEDNAQYKYFDFTNTDTFDNALQDVDRVFVMRPPHLGKPEDLRPFIDALKKRGGIRLVSFLSLIGVENNPVPPHHKIEKNIEQACLPYCHIRPSFFMQNLSGVHAFEIKHFNRIVVPVKHALTSFIDAQDIGEITARVLSDPERHENRSYSVTGPEAIGYHEVAKILSEELGRMIVFADPSPFIARKYWNDIRGLDKEYSNVISMLYFMTRMGTAKKVTTTFREIMGKEPQTFRQFVKKNLAAWI